MKKITMLLTAVACSFGLFAQQEGINYQAALRDNGGAIMANQNVTVDFDILEGSANGSVVYSEAHATTTNEFGIVNVVIGEGVAVTGSYQNIDWAGDSHFLRMKVDGTTMGTTQFQAVPYAKHAESLTNIRTNTADGDVLISSDDTHAEIIIQPLSNATNDSTTLFLSEGSTHENGMGLRYSGEDNALKVIGGTLVNPELGPFLTIERDSGKSTFSNGVEVEETTDSPEPKRYYGNSGPLAYGFINGATSVATDYGVTSVNEVSTGVFEVILDNDWVGLPVVVATSFNSSSATEVVTYSTNGTNIIIFRIVNESNTPQFSNFSFVVYGMPQ